MPASWRTRCATRPAMASMFRSWRHDWPLLKQLRDEFIGRINAIYERNLDKRKVELLRGHARLMSAQSIAGRGAGDLGRQRSCSPPAASRSFRTLPGAQLGHHLGRLLRARASARDSVAVVGAGYIAAELSGIFSALGLAHHGGVAARVHAAAFRCDARRLTDGDHARRGHRVRAPTRCRNHWRAMPPGCSSSRSRTAACSGQFDALIWAIGRAAHDHRHGPGIAGREARLAGPRHHR